MNRRVLTPIFLIGWVVMSGDALALRIGERGTDQIGKGLMVQQSLSFPSAQRGNQYLAYVRRDPFVPLNRSRMQRPSRSEQPNGPMGESDVPKVMGIAFGPEGYHAILLRADGQRILVRPGSLLDHEHARVIRITDDTVLLEYRLNENGRTRLLEHRLSIHHSNTTGGSS
ncbi:MAG: hypothetical protein VST68_05965 [Nitrospirota bacterium]|nr:hypothetical protein [Nitrospirota bacterium]